MARFFVRYANTNEKINIKAHILCNDKVDLINLKSVIERGGVAIARVWQQGEHYVIITKIDENFAYIFDPYYLDEDYYYKDSEVAVVLNDNFTHNRLVKLSRLFDERKVDFSLLPVEDREVILLER